MRMMEYVRNGGINYVFISGDLFESEYATNNTIELLVREFRNCPDTNFIIAPGCSDSYNGNPIYESGRLPSNCYIFDSESMTRFDFDDDKVRIYGWGFTSPELRENPLIDKQVDDISKINIVVGYADIDGSISSEKCPISTADLKRFGADYYAFGSRHDGGDFVSLEDSMYSYSGALESIGFDNPGIGGAKLVVVKYSGGELSIDAKNMSFGQIAFRTERMDITGVSTNHEIINRVSRLVSEKKYGSETALKVELVGDIDPRFIVPKNLGSDAFGLYSFEVVDKTMPLYGTEYLRRDMSVKGELFRQLLPMMESDNEEEKLLGAKAMPDAVVIDGTIITSRGMGTAIAFGAALVSVLVSDEAAEDLLKAIQY
jgi:DNA repair exonuclease SbcCD nuclease subunit